MFDNTSPYEINVPVCGLVVVHVHVVVAHVNENKELTYFQCTPTSHPLLSQFLSSLAQFITLSLCFQSFLSQFLSSLAHFITLSLCFQSFLSQFLSSLAQFITLSLCFQSFLSQFPPSSFFLLTHFSSLTCMSVPSPLSISLSYLFQYPPTCFLFPLALFQNQPPSLPVSTQFYSNSYSFIPLPILLPSFCPPPPPPIIS